MMFTSRNTLGLILLLTILVLGVNAPSLFAVPARPAPFTLHQPDGPEFQARLQGDEWTNWTETIDGYPIVHNETTDFWEYGRIEQNKGLLSNGQVVGRDKPIGVNKIKISDMRASLPSSSPQRAAAVAASTPPQGAPLNVMGNQKLLVILVNFANRTLKTTETSWYNRIFGATNSVKAYYEEVSRHQIHIVPAEEKYGTANNGVVVVTLSYNHPNTGSNTDVTNEQLTKDAIIAAEPYVDFASFDTNGDGKITTDELHIMVVPAGFEASYSNVTPSVWGHKWDIEDITPPVVNGVSVGGLPGGYMQCGELHGDSRTVYHQATIGIMCHELGHDLGSATRSLGFIDLYDTTDNSAGIGNWCLMAGGAWLYTTGYSGDTPSHFCAWCKYYAGWVTPTQISGPTPAVSFPQVENSNDSDGGIKQVLNNPDGPEIGGAGEYFLIENRQKTGYDAALPGAGLLIWHIDETRSDNDTVSDKLVALEEADGLNEMALSSDNRGTDGDPYPGQSNNRTFDYSSNPNSRLYSGANSKVAVINISNSNAIMTADISNEGRYPVLTSPGNKSVNQNQLLTFTLSAVDPDGDTIAYSMAGTATGATLNATTGVFSWRPNYSQAGNYVIIFTASSGIPSLSDSKTVTITVISIDRPPALATIGDKTVNEGQPLTFTISATDPDGDAITYSMAPILTGATLNPVTPIPSGQAAVFSWTPDYSQSGSYVVTFTATSNLLSDSKSITITVRNVNRPPVLNALSDKTTAENTLLTFTVSATDPDGDAITYSASGLPTGVTLDSNTGTFSWTPTYSQAGSYIVIFTAMANGLTDSKSITITVNDVTLPPEQVTTPNPANGATNVPITITLTWAVTSGADSYDVYFGPQMTQINFVTNTANTSLLSTFYSLLSYSTTYYWRIDAKNPSGTTAGAVWRFATMPPFPAQVESLDPPNGATGCPVTQTLSWAPAATATSYDIYFGPTIGSIELIANSITATSYTLSALSYNTTYYWRVDSRNNVGITTGNVWTFTTTSIAPVSSSGTTAGSSGQSGAEEVRNKWRCGLMGPEPFILIGLILLFRRRKVN